MNFGIRLCFLACVFEFLISSTFGLQKPFQVNHRRCRQYNRIQLNKFTYVSSTSTIIDISEGEIDNSRAKELLKSLSRVVDPESGKDIVTNGFVADLELTDTGDVNFKLIVPQSYSSIIEDVKEVCISEIKKLSWIGDIRIGFSYQAPTTTPFNTLVEAEVAPPGMASVRNIIAVSSCKGGVGKSTVAVNLAYTLSQAGAKVGILDADIYGPSLPTMTKPPSTEIVFRNNQLYPVEYEGVKLMSMGFLNKGAAIMRGPMVNQILNQFVRLTQWGDLDYLIVDMPPGTGDIQLTLAQIMNITAAVIVTTPTRLSFVDVVKGIDLFDTVNVPSVAVVENMAEYQAFSFPDEFYKKLAPRVAATVSASMALSPDIASSYDSVAKLIRDSVEGQRAGKRIFGDGHLQRLRDMWGMDKLVSLPLISDVANSGDSGTPYVLSYPDSPVSLGMEELAIGVISEIERMHSEGSSQSTFTYDKDSNMLIFNGQRKLSPSALRRDCRCAVCVEEFTGRQLLKPESVPETVRPLNMAPIGRYAMSVDWSDGHKSLYPFRQIKALAEI